jgi:Copper type II ascorbate-dependent monooxygenase, C-terminal domain
LCRCLSLCVTVAVTQALAQSQVNFSKDVAPIFFQKCAACHRPNDVAPMSLLSYQSARPWAKAIREAVLSKKMPPWHADPAYGEFKDDARLTPAQIETIRAWVDQGAQEGDPRNQPPAPKIEDGWRIGKPDLVISMPDEYTIPASGPDDYERFSGIPTNLKEDVWISAIELRPGNRKVVHHAHIYVTPPKTASDAEHGQSLFEKYTYKEGTVLHVRSDAPVVDDACRDIGEGGLPDQKYHEEAEELATYVPGRAPEVYPEGYARLIPAGSTITFEIHYSKGTGKLEKDRSSVGFIFAKHPQKVLRRLDMDAYLFRIPAGAPNHEVTFCHEFTEDVNLLSFTPHMHLRGKDMRWELVGPDAVKRTLMFIPHYDFNWQMQYALRDPVPAPKGSRLVISVHFDNSANNPFNPDPTRTIRWGEPTSDEMAATWIMYELAHDQSPIVHRETTASASTVQPH